MAKPELGEKRICLECSTKYYDLNRDPITCPKCGTVFEMHDNEKVKPEKEAEPEAKPAADETEDELEADGPEIISLEDAEVDDGETVDGDEEIPSDIPDVEIEDDDDDDAADGPFLEDDDDENDNLADIIPVRGDDKEDI